jgi:dephospho-CoA kinase
MTKRHPKKIFIGLVGEKGGGKDTVMKFVQKLLPKKKIAQIRFSDVLTDTLDIWGLAKSRANYQKLSPAMIDAYGKSALANAVRMRSERADADIVFINGVRWRADAAMVRALNKKGARSFLIYVTAPARVRYLRLKQRGEKVGEKTATFRQFMKEERARTERDIPKIGKTADVIINNTGSMDEFYEAVKSRILPLLEGKRP